MSTADEICQIKAELYDIQHHNCNGSVTINPSEFVASQGLSFGTACTLCTRTMELRRRLQTLLQEQQPTIFVSH